MKILAFGDIHFHHSHRYSTIKSEGFSIRELEHLSCADVIVDLYHKYNIDKVVCLGDLWGPVGDTMSCQTLTAMTAFFKKLTDNFEIDVIIGNHDISGQVNNKYSHKLVSFSGWKNIHLFDKPTIVDNFVYMPYCLSNEQAENFLSNIKDKENKIIFSHLDLKGIPIGDLLYTKTGTDVNLLKKFKMTLQGHYHNGGSYAKNIQVAGSTQRLSFKDQGIARRNIIIYDTETNKVVRESFNCPDWLTFDDYNIDDLLTIDDNNYVKLDLTTDILLTKDIKAKLDKVKNCEVHIDLTRIHTNKKVTESIEEESEIDVLQKFISSTENDEQVKKDLLDEGLRLIKCVS